MTRTTAVLDREMVKTQLIEIFLEAWAGLVDSGNFEIIGVGDSRNRKFIVKPVGVTSDLELSLGLYTRPSAGLSVDFFELTIKVDGVMYSDMFRVESNDRLSIVYDRMFELDRIQDCGSIIQILRFGVKHLLLQLRTMPVRELKTRHTR